MDHLCNPVDSLGAGAGNKHDDGRFNSYPAGGCHHHDTRQHHFRPKVHWTRMQAFRDQIVEQQRAAGVRVIKPPHALGFLDPDLPKLGKSQPHRAEQTSSAS